MTIKLPDIPTPREFDNPQQYGLALDTWMQACRTIVAGNVAVVGKHDQPDGWIEKAAKRIHDQYPQTSVPLICTVIQDAVNGTA